VIRSRVLLAGLCAVSAALAFYGSVFGAGLPEWARAVVEAADGLGAPDATAVELYRSRSVSVKVNGSRKVRDRSILLLNKGEYGEPRRCGFRESPHHRLTKMEGWRASPDGSVDVFKDRVRTQLSENSLYRESLTHILEIPRCVDGSVVVFETEWVNDFLLSSDDWWPIEGSFPLLHWEYELRLPSGWEAEAHRLDPFLRSAIESEPALLAGDPPVYRWTGTPAPADSSNLPRAVSREDEREILHVQFFDGTGEWKPNDSWRAIGKWYAEVGRAAFDGSEGLSDREGQMLDFDSDKEAAARRIPEYVQSSIRYVSIELGDGAYRPNRAVDVLRNGHGDCKDMTFLAVALLRRAGIAAYPALTLLSTERTVWPGFPSVAQFNHCIVAIAEPNGYRFFDPTAKTIPFGRLPFPLEGGHALVVGSPVDTGLVRMPESAPGDNRSIEEVRLLVEEDLSCTGVATEKRTGQAAFGARAALSGHGREALERYLKARLSAGMPGAEVLRADVTGLDELSDTLVFRYRFRAPKVGVVSGSNLMIRPYFLDVQFPLLSNDPGSDVEIYAAFPALVEAAITVDLPADWSVAEIPEPCSLSNDFGSYSSEVTWSETGIALRRTVELRATRSALAESDQGAEWERTLSACDRQRVVAKKR